MSVRHNELMSGLLGTKEKIIGEPTPLNGASYLVNILDGEGTVDKSVFLIMPHMGDRIEAVKLDADVSVRLRVRAVRGRGRIVLQRAGKVSYSSHPIFSANGHEGVAFTIREGDTYGYHSTSEEPLIIRDDSDIPFLEEYESDAKESSVGRFNSSAAERRSS